MQFKTLFLLATGALIPAFVEAAPLPGDVSVSPTVVIPTKIADLIDGVTKPTTILIPIPIKLPKNYGMLYPIEKDKDGYFKPPPKTAIVPKKE